MECNDYSMIMSKVPNVAENQCVSKLPGLVSANEKRCTGFIYKTLGSYLDLLFPSG
jgi:hypothetical protein